MVYSALVLKVSQKLSYIDLHPIFKMSIELHPWRRRWRWRVLPLHEAAAVQVHLVIGRAAGKNGLNIMA